MENSPPSAASGRRTTPPPAGASSPLIRWIAIAILAWGVFQAVGAWRFNHNPLRAVVVLVCVAAFLGFWLAMLAVRRRRLTRQR